MTGLQKLCKLYGQIEVQDSTGKKVVWFWDYANDKPRLKDEMSTEEIRDSETAKWQQIKAQEIEFIDFNNQ